MIEILFGIWKSRFQCLKGNTGRGSLRFRSPLVSASIVMACGCLQNFLVSIRDDEEVDDAEYSGNMVLSDGSDALPIHEEVTERELNAGKQRLASMKNLFRSFNDL